MEDEKDLIIKLAKAKAFYLNLCEMIDIRHSILTGRIRGSKNDWNTIKDTIDRGKTFFDGVKGIGKLIDELPKEGKDEKTTIS